MPEIPDVVGGTPVESAWGNLIRDRAMLRYSNAAARDASEIAPLDGRFCYLEDEDAVYQRAGGVWILIADKYGSPLSKVDVNPQTVAGPVSMSSLLSTPGGIESLGPVFMQNQIITKGPTSGTVTFQTEEVHTITAGEIAAKSGVGRLWWVTTHGTMNTNPSYSRDDVEYFMQHAISGGGTVLSAIGVQRTYFAAVRGVLKDSMSVQNWWVPGSGEGLDIEIFVSTGAEALAHEYSGWTTTALLVG